MCPRNQGLRYMMNGCTHLNGTESRLVGFLFYDDCSSYMHKSEMDFSIPGITDSERIASEWNQRSRLQIMHYLQNRCTYSSFDLDGKESFGMHRNDLVICLFYLKKALEWGTFSTHSHCFLE